MKKEPDIGFWAAVIALLRLISDLITGAEKKRKRKEIETAKAELAKALAEGRITDAGYWRKRLNQLEAARHMRIIRFNAILMACLVSGCVAPQPQPMPLVIGERINKVKPGEVVAIPKLQPPAKQWYLVDDVGLLEWMGINPPSK